MIPPEPAFGEASNQEPKRCGWCDNPLLEDETFCPRCGIATSGPLSQPGAFHFTPKNHFIVAVLIVAAVFAVAYRSLEAGKLMQTYAAFVGLPLLIGVLTTYLVRSKNSLGATLKATTIMLCIVSTLLGEGLICILMAAPIFYTVAVMGLVIVEAFMKAFGPGRRGGPMMLLVLLPFIAGKLTSTPHGIANPRTMTVQNDTFIAASPDRVWSTLLHGQLVSTEFPLFLRLGFPLPKKLQRGADGIARLTFDPGSEAWPGTNTIVSREVRDAAARRLTFVILQDGTKLSRWLTFRKTVFVVEPRPGGCRLRQITTFRQRMQPGLYWNPLQSFAMTQMHRYALNHIKQLAEIEPLPRQTTPAPKRRK